MLWSWLLAAQGCPSGRTSLMPDPTAAQKGFRRVGCSPFCCKDGKERTISDSLNVGDQGVGGGGDADRAFAQPRPQPSQAHTVFADFLLRV